MILNIIKADYLQNFIVSLQFNTGESFVIDLKDTIMNDHRKIFTPLKDLNYFRNFQIKFNTITWENEADFAPEFLLELGKSQMNI